MTNKGRILAFPDAAATEAEAAAWVARFDAGDVSAQEQAAFQEWLSRSPLHREAIAEYGNLWSEFESLKLLTDSDDAGRHTGARDPIAVVPHRARPWLAACAAAALVAAGGTALFHTRLGDFATAPPPARISYETPVGGQKRIALADGTSVILNTNSRLDVDFSGKCRNVHLIRGEAFFEVVHDKTRPFSVYANNYVVRDIGTAFDVHLSKTGLVEVGVTKGSVEVQPARGAHVPDAVKKPDVLTAGQDIVLGERVADAMPDAVAVPKIERPEVVSSPEMGRRLAWRQGQLIYTGQPLEEVLADISRYSNIKIELADPSLADLPVGGAFRTDQIQAIFAALENNFGVHAEWIDPQHVRFTSAHDRSPTKE
jgi:transmembrane sensor